MNKIETWCLDYTVVRRWDMIFYLCKIMCLGCWDWDVNIPDRIASSLLHCSVDHNSKVEPKSQQWTFFSRTLFTKGAKVNGCMWMQSTVFEKKVPFLTYEEIQWKTMILQAIQSVQFQSHFPVRAQSHSRLWISVRTQRWIAHSKISIIYSRFSQITPDLKWNFSRKSWLGIHLDKC